MPDGKKLPDPRCLTAFSAFSRTGSVHAAAAELGVSTATVSRRLATLQKWSEKPLLRVDGRLLRLTPLGVAFSRRLTLYNRQLEAALCDLVGASPQHEVVTVLLSGALSLAWMTSRLIELALLFPHIEVRLVSGINDPYWFNRSFDLALTRTDNVPSFIAADFAAADQVTLVIADNRVRDLVYANKNGPTLDWFRQQPIARCIYNAHEIDQWFSVHQIDVALADFKEMPTLISCLGELAAAQCSLILSRLFIEDGISERVVCEPWPQLRTNGQNWYVCRKMNIAQRDAVEKVADFLKTQIRTTLRKPPLIWPDLPFAPS